MKKMIIVLALVLSLSGCHSQKFTTGESQINLKRDLDSIVETMMKKGNYADDLKVPYDKTVLAIDYSQNIIEIETISFSVFRRQKDKEYEYDLTSCFDDIGSLVCKEERGLITSETRTEEVLLLDVVGIYADIDIKSIMEEVGDYYETKPFESILIIASLVLPEDIENDFGRYDNIAFYYDDSYHYENTNNAINMMLRVKVYVIGNEQGETYVSYFEIK